MRRWMLAIALLTALPGLAQAQQVVVTPVERPGVELTLQGDAGAWFPTNTAIADVGFAFGARAGLQLAPWLGIEAQYLGTARIDDPFITDTLRFDSITGNVKLMARSRLGRVAQLTPYATAGAGAYFFSGAATRGPNPVVLPGGRLDVPLGVGLMLDLGPTVSIGAEGKYHFLFGPGGLAQNATDAISVLANLSFRI